MAVSTVFSSRRTKLDVTALLADFNEPRCLETPFDFAEGLRLKPPQPRSCGPWAAAWLEAARNEVPALPLSWRLLLLQSRLDRRYRLQGTERHTSPLLSRLSR